MTDCTCRRLQIAVKYAAEETMKTGFRSKARLYRLQIDLSAIFNSNKKHISA